MKVQKIELTDEQRKSLALGPINFAMNTKPIWQSKTFWLNVIGLIVLIANALQPMYPSGPIAAVIAPVLAVGNVIVRFFTNQGVTLK